MTKQSTQSRAKKAAPLVLPETQAAAVSAIADAIRTLHPEAFFLTGPLGSGKTTVLQSLRELASTQGASPVLGMESNLWWAWNQEIGDDFRLRRVACCMVSLANQAERPLQEVVETALRRDYPRLFPGSDSLISEPRAVAAGLALEDLDILLVLVDELSAFLNSRSPSATAGDLLFLQRLGERITSDSLPMILVAAQQENLRGVDASFLPISLRIADTYRVLSLHIEGALSASYSSGALRRREERRFHSFQARLRSAIAYYEEVDSRTPGAEWVKANLTDARNALAEYKEIAAAAESAFVEHRYKQAVHFYDRILAKDFGNDEVRRAVQRARVVQSHIDDAESALRKQNYPRAYESLSRALNADRSNSDLRRRCDAARKDAIDQLTSRGKSAESKKDYATALECFREVLAIAPEQMDISERLNAIEELLQRQGRRELLNRESPVCTPIRCHATSASGLEFNPAHPVRNLAHLVELYSDSDDVDLYLDSKEILGKTMQMRVLELCVKDDPLEILRDLVPAGKTLRLADDLGLPAKGRPIESIRQALLLKLGFLLPRKPVGIGSYRARTVQLRGRLKLCDERSDMIGIGLEACDDIGERVLRDLIQFYCTELMGPDYQNRLREGNLLPADSRPGIDSLTFGKTMGLIQGLNGHIKGNPDLRQQMRSSFGRDWIIDNGSHIHKYLNQVSPRRNHLAHSDGLATEVLKQDADEALDLLSQFYEQLEGRMIYPPVVVVETRMLDRFGRVTYECVDDHGRPERVFTSLDLKVGAEYFLYPITNPIRVDPIIVARREAVTSEQALA